VCWHYFAIAGELGLMVGVFGAFVAEYFEGWERGKEGTGEK